MYFYVYRDQANQWRWTLYAANHRKIANCCEGYHNQTDCVADINNVANTRGVPIKYAT